MARTDLGDTFPDKSVLDPRSLAFKFFGVMGGTMKKKHTKGQVVEFLSQKQAMRRLQISLPNFRRLCILKGIYPVEPRSRKKVGKGNSQPRVYYNAKDIAFLSHEPLIETFRKLRIFHLKLKKARERKDREKEFRVKINKPRYTLHQIVKERYPTRQDALRDISDSLNLLFLFAKLPKLTQFHPALTSISRRLCVEFLNLVVATQAVRKAFISIKGFYVQAEIDGTAVVWIMPHTSVTHTPADVDYRILATCLEFDATLVGSLMCHLYRINNLVYPPKLAVRIEHDPNGYFCGQKESLFEFMSSLSFPLKRTEASTDVDTDDLTELQAIDEQVSEAINKQLEVQNLKKLFKNKRFFLMREVPREVICLIVRSCGGECSWDKIVSPGYTFQEDDPTIDYQVVDRPMTDMKLTRYYVQPQWVFDCLNAGRLLPTQDYLPGCSLPPHLSPFVGSVGTDELLDTAVMSLSRRGGLVGVAPGFGDGASIYRPPEADYLAGLVSLAEIRGAKIQAQSEGTIKKPSAMDDEILDSFSAETETDPKTSVQTMKRRKLKKVSKGVEPKITPGRAESKGVKLHREKEEANAERKLRELMLPKKHKNVYKKMVHSIKRKEKEVRQLKAKRRRIDM
ncbi:Pescadillo like [Schistosoma japonicum]|nr:Pescadillo like [Schistosoma japonicum]